MKPVTIEDAIRTAEELPPFPTNALAVIRKLEDPNVGVSEIASLITVDEVLASKLLRWANSPLWGISRRVTTVSTAVVTLGFSAVKSLIYTVCMAPLLNRPVGGYQVGRLMMWKHALMCAILSRDLGSRLHVSDSESFYLTGLLHDVGMLVLSNCAKFKIGDMRKLAADHPDVPLIQLERERLGIDHAEVGAAVLEQWNIPSSIVELVRWHHDPMRLGTREAHIIHLADYTSIEVGLGLGIDLRNYPLAPRSHIALGLEQDDVDKIAEDSLATFKETFSHAIGA